MKCLVFSDSHGKNDRIFTVLRREKDFDLVIHLGDLLYGEEEIGRVIEQVKPLCPFKYVYGNCDDYAGIQPAYTVITCGSPGFRILLTHGHRLGVSRGMEELRRAAVKEDARIVLYGHTHKADILKENGILFMNPGSISEPRPRKTRASYGILSIDPESGRYDGEICYL